MIDDDYYYGLAVLLLLLLLLLLSQNTGVFIARFSLVCISIFPQKQTLESAPRLRLLIA